MQIYTPWLCCVKFQLSLFFSMKISWCCFDCSTIVFFFFLFSKFTVCTSHNWSCFLRDAHGLWEVITRDGNLIFTQLVTLKHLIFVLERHLIFITSTHISIVIVLFSHKLWMQMTKRAAICFQSMHRKSWEGDKRHNWREGKKQNSLFYAKSLIVTTGRSAERLLVSSEWWVLCFLFYVYLHVSYCADTSVDCDTCAPGCQHPPDTIYYLEVKHIHAIEIWSLLKVYPAASSWTQRCCNTEASVGRWHVFPESYDELGKGHLT